MELYNTLQTVYSFAVKLALVVLGINIILSLIKIKRLNTNFKRLVFILVLSLTTEIFAHIFIQLKINNLPLLHLYTLGEFLLFSYFYTSILSHSKRSKAIIRYLMIVGSLLIICNSIWLQNIYGFNSYAKTFVQICIIAYAVVYFYNITDSADQPLGQSKAIRLINSGVLIYYSGSLFIFMYGKFSLYNTQEYVMFWGFNAILNFVFQLLILIGIWKAFYQKKTFLP